MLVIFVAVLGYATLTGRMNYNDGVNRIIRMTFVVLFVTSASVYNEYVVSFFTTGLPDSSLRISPARRLGQILARVSIPY